MKLRSKINKFRKSLFDRFITYKMVRIFTSAVILIYLPLIIIGVIVAAYFDPDGYSIITNWISDLGGSPHTPAPYLYDIACIVAGTLTIPFAFYLENLLAPLPKRQGTQIHFSRMRFRLVSSAFLFSLIGSIGYIGVGIFSEDRNFYNLHTITSSLAFGGFTLGAFFMGWTIVLYDTKIPKLLGLYGIIGPLTTIIIFLLISNPLWEWILLFSILAWIIPLSLIVFGNEELKPQ
ncbi:MAG: DUF998 domain-containing protein [Promethearchaeota archaeon]|nr:MAG: DUF998 domain-containing protein [Candidatus Lokiarchaeota archaeon]